jgi:hypothetical protein
MINALAANATDPLMAQSLFNYSDSSLAHGT